MLIYLVRNKVNGKVYVGKTTQALEARWRQHVRDSRKKVTHFYLALRKYGLSAFELSVLSSSAESHEQLNEQEIYFIAKFKANDRAIGYNTTKGGDGVMAGRHQSIVSRAKIGLAHRGKRRRASWRRNMALARLGKKLSEQAKQNMSQARKDVPLSEVHKAKLRGKRGPQKNPCLKRSPCSQVTKDKISLAHKRRLACS
jgi:group I intron endonuclease